METDLVIGMLMAIERTGTAHTGADMQMMALEIPVSKGKTGSLVVRARQNVRDNLIRREGRKDPDMHRLADREITCHQTGHGTPGQDQVDDRRIRMGRGTARDRGINMHRDIRIEISSRIGHWIGEPSRRAEGSESWSGL